MSDAELAELGLQALANVKSAILAVSGGADSIALMQMVARLQSSPDAIALPIHVATVDHGLRPEAAAEARWVGQQARQAGLAHHVLVWNGPKPASGVQEAARQARYALLAGLARDLVLPRPIGILLGHHRDDQAETFVMRLARGSGVDGLAGMQSEVELPGHEGIVLVRPFLGIGKATLVATLSRLGADWLDDPSNDNPDFERVRVRRALVTLAEAGVDSAEIATSARRLTRARLALEHATDKLAQAALETNGGAFGQIKTAVFDAAPAELRLRLLTRVVRQFGDGQALTRMAKLEALEDRLAAGGAVTATLAGCQLARRREGIVAVREPGRRGLPVLTLSPGESRLWDNRFVVAVASARAEPVVVKALTVEGLAQINRARRQAGRPAVALPRAACFGLPSFWAGDRLLAVPHPGVGWFSEIDATASLAAVATI